MTPNGQISTTNQPIKVFISRLTEDQKVASLLKDHLHQLSSGRLDPKTCDDIRGGKDYREEIFSFIKNSDIFILLHTKKDVDLSWCMVEAGVFIGAKNPKNRHLICFKGNNITSLHDSIANLQAYTSNTEGIRKFLIELICDGGFTNGERLNERLFSQDDRLKKACGDLEKLFIAANGTLSVSGEHPTKTGEAIPVFIIHRPNDEKIARLLRDKLKILGNDVLNPISYHQFKPGCNFEEEIGLRMKEASIIIFLYTQEDKGLAGFMSGSGTISARSHYKTHFICIKSKELEMLPYKVQKMVTYQGDGRGIKDFLTDMVYKGKFTAKAKDRNQLTESEEADFTTAVLEIEKEFSLSVIDSEFFRKRLSIEFFDDSSEISFEKSKITANDETLNLLSISKDSKWGRLYEVLKKRGQHSWLEQLHDAVENIKSRDETILSALKPFTSGLDHKEYVPILARIEKKPRRPVRLIVIFLESNFITKQNEGQMPADHMAITILIKLALDLRWNIIEPFISEIERPDADLAILSKNLHRSLTEYVNNSNARAETVRICFPPDRRTYVDTSIQEFRAAMIEIGKLAKNPDRDSLRNALNMIRSSNKVFLREGTMVCLNKIQELEPANLGGDDN